MFVERVAAQVAGIVAQSIKATMPTRDKTEPGRRRKLAFEARIAAAVAAYLKRQKAKFLAAHHTKAEGDNLDPEFENECGAILLKAVTDGLLLVDSISGVSIDTEKGHALAKAWATARARDLAKEIQGTTDDQIAAAIEKFASESGVTMGDIAADLFSEEVIQSRAEMIATTEITRAYAESNMEAAEQMAEQYPDVPIVKRWATNADSLVCDICGPFNQKEQPYDEPFQTDDGDIDAPPAHPNCRCWIMTYPKL